MQFTVGIFICSSTASAANSSRPPAAPVPNNYVPSIPRLLTEPEPNYSYADLISYTRDWRRPKDPAKYAIIAMFGVPQAGKTSYLNGVARALTGEWSNIAEVASTLASDSTVSQVTERYRLFSVENTMIRIWNTVGVRKGDYSRDFIGPLLDGHIKSGTSMHDRPISQDKSWNTYPDRWQRTDVVLLFINCSDIVGSDLKEEGIIMKAARDREIRVVVVVSKTDEFDPKLTSHPEQLYTSVPVAAAVAELSRKFGCSPTDIILLANSTDGNCNPIVDRQILAILKRALRQVELADTYDN